MVRISVEMSQDRLANSLYFLVYNLCGILIGNLQNNGTSYELLTRDPHP